MTPADAEIALMVLKAARLVASQISIASLDQLTPEKRAELLDARDAVNQRFDDLMPRD